MKNIVFSSCVFKGKLPSFFDCEFFGCDLSQTKVSELIKCKLFSTNLDKADFSTADIRFSITSAALPCSARGAEWQGVSATLDCGFWQGLKGTEKDAEIFLIMALIPDTPLKKKLYKSFSEELKLETRRRMEQNFRST